MAKDRIVIDISGSGYDACSCDKACEVCRCNETPERRGRHEGALEERLELMTASDGHLFSRPPGKFGKRRF